MTSRQGLYVALFGLVLAVQCAVPMLPPMNAWFFHHPETTGFDAVFYYLVGAGLLFGVAVMVVGLIAAGVLALTKSPGKPSR